MGKCMFMRKGETHSAPEIGLPSGYTELMYIESSGTQYIDTGFKPNQDSRVVLDAQMLEGSAPTKTKIYFGCRSGGQYFEIYKASSSGQTLHFLYNTGVGGEYSVDYTLRRTVEINKNVATVDGISKEATYATFQIDRTIFIGADNNDGTPASITSIRIYTCQIYDNGTLVRDFVPCINPDGEIGLYDSVTKQFFSNAGTGYFSGMDLDGNVISASIKASDLAVGSTVYLNENGSPVEYLVVNQGIPSSSSLYDSSCNGTWLLRKNLHSSQNWNSSYISNYQSSTIQSYLNNTFFNALDGIARSAIKQVKIPYVNGDGTGNVASGTSGLSAKVFLPSGYEIGWTSSNHSKIPVDGACLSYFKGASNNTRIAYLNGTATQWWVRSPRTGINNAVWYAGTNGSYDQYAEAPNVSKGIRPALILPSNAIFDADTMILKGVA